MFGYMGMDTSCTTRFNNIAIESYIQVFGSSTCGKLSQTFFLLSGNCDENMASRENIVSLGEKQAFQIKIQNACFSWTPDTNFISAKNCRSIDLSYFTIEM